MVDVVGLRLPEGVSVLRQLIHYAVQVWGRQIFTHGIIPWTKKIVFITAKKIHFNSYFLLFLYSKKVRKVFGFGIGILPFNLSATIINVA